MLSYLYEGDTMTQNEIISKLKTKENDIINKMDRLSYKNEYITIDDRTIKNNKMFNEIKSNFNFGFLGYYSKDLHNMFDKSTKYSLYKYMPSSVLEYYYTFLLHLEEYINDQGSLDFYDDKVGIKRYALLQGEHYKKVYKDEYKKKPFTHVEQLNSDEYLLKILKEKLELFGSYDEDFIKFKVNELSNVLNSYLPKYYSNKKGYGSTIGCINSAFYQMKQEEILQRFKANNIKGIDSINKVMDKKHLLYRLVVLYYADKYKDKYSKDDFVLYLSKISSISHMLKEDFESKYEIDPYIDLLGLAREYKNKDDKKYKLFNKKEEILIDDGYQQDMLDMLSKPKIK